MLFPSNRYRAIRYVTEEIETKLKRRHLIGNDNGINVAIKFEKHLSDRLIDYDVTREEFSYILDGLLDNICVFIYTFKRANANRINVYGKNDLMFGITGKQTENGNFIFNIRTIYYERNAKYRQREIQVEKLYIEELYRDRTAKCTDYIQQLNESLRSGQSVLLQRPNWSSERWFSIV